MKSKRSKNQNVHQPKIINQDEFLLAALIRFTERGYQGEVSGVYMADLVIMLDMGVDRGDL